MSITGYSDNIAFLETNTRWKIEKLGFVPHGKSISDYSKKLYDNNERIFFSSDSHPYVIASVHHLGFDSNIYNKKIGALNIFINPSDMLINEKSNDVIIFINQIREFIKANDYEMIVCRQPLEQLFWIQTLEEIGFRIMDIQCPLILRKSDNLDININHFSSSTTIRDLVPEDIAPLISFGKSAFGKSHLYADKNLALVLSDKLHEMWLKNDFTGRANFTLTFLVKNKVTGFVACLFDHDKEALLGIRHGHIDLISVSEEFQGQGIGKLLMHAALDRYSKLKYDIITVSTQATNIKAINLYQKMGFKMSGFEVTLHGWFD